MIYTGKLAQRGQAKATDEKNNNKKKLYALCWFASVRFDKKTQHTSRVTRHHSNQGFNLFTRAV